MAIPIIAAGIGAAGAIGAALISNQQPKQAKVKETKTELYRRQLLDELIGSLRSGGGEFGGIFDTSEEGFQKNYVEPAKARFQNQIAPSIQQKYIAGGQQLNSGLNDQLLRAGVDMDQLLNEQYGNLREKAMDRKANLLNTAIGGNTGTPTQSGGGFSSGQAASIGAANYLGSDAFGKNVEDILNHYGSNSYSSPRKGFEMDGQSPVI